MTCSATYNSEKVTEAAVERCFLKITADKVWEKKVWVFYSDITG